MSLLSCGIAERLFPSAPNSLILNDDGKGKHAESRTAQGGGASEHLAADLVNGIGDGPLEARWWENTPSRYFPPKKSLAKDRDGLGLLLLLRSIHNRRRMTIQWGAQRQSTSSQKTPCWKYSISSRTEATSSSGGTRWCTCASDGDGSCSPRSAG
ncbi:hypothetical protein BC826DRAFT_308755 [Russula brevipes]|nr:hypothetical protein BC826DRAFT_308755 [Russula brevipes]